MRYFLFSFSFGVFVSWRLSIWDSANDGKQLPNNSAALILVICSVVRTHSCLRSVKTSGSVLNRLLPAGPQSAPLFILPASWLSPSALRRSGDRRRTNATAVEVYCLPGDSSAGRLQRHAPPVTHGTPGTGIPVSTWEFCHCFGHAIEFRLEGWVEGAVDPVIFFVYLHIILDRLDS